MGLLVPVTLQQDTVVHTAREVQETVADPPDCKGQSIVASRHRGTQGTVTFLGGIPT